MNATASPRSSELELLQSVVARHPAAVRRFLDEVAPVVYGYIYARIGGDQPAAEDLLQDTLLEAVRSAGGFRGESALSTWLCAIARRRLARYYEAERRAEAARRGLYVVEEAEEEPALEVAERRDEVIRALGQLSPLHRQVLVIKYLDGCTVEQVAEQLGRTTVQTQSLLQRARDSLRRHLEEVDRG